MATERTKYVDDQWFVDKMKEGLGSEEKLHSYPVKVIATRIDWILNEDIGKHFLESLYHSENLEYYNIMFLRTLIEHMFK
jgi:hypothetical protein